MAVNMRHEVYTKLVDKYEVIELWLPSLGRKIFFCF